MTTTRNHSTAGNGATHSHASRVGRARIADEGQEAAERTRSTPPAVFSEAAKVAGQDKSATLRLGPRQKKGKSSLPMCVGCLLAIGWGQKRISRHTGFAKTSVHRWAKFNGVDLSATAGCKKQAEMAVRKRKAAEKEAARKAERKARPKKSAIDRYYANHEREKARSRVAAR